MSPLRLSGVIVADNRFDAAGSVGPQQWQAACAALAPLAAEIVWVHADPVAMLEHDGLILRDHFQPPGLLSAIHAGLFAAGHDHALVLAAGLALPAPPVLDLLRQALAPRWDGVLLEVGGQPLPLPAVYHKRCLKLLARQLAQGRRDPSGFLRQLHRHRIDAEFVRRADPRWTPSFPEP